MLLPNNPDHPENWLRAILSTLARDKYEMGTYPIEEDALTRRRTLARSMNEMAAGPRLTRELGELDLTTAKGTHPPMKGINPFEGYNPERKARKAEARILSLLRDPDSHLYEAPGPSRRMTRTNFLLGGLPEDRLFPETKAELEYQMRDPKKFHTNLLRQVRHLKAPQLLAASRAAPLFIVGLMAALLANMGGEE